MSMARAEWTHRQQKKVLVASFLVVIAILIGVYAMPTRHLFPAVLQLACIGISTWLYIHVWVSYVHKWVAEGGVDPYSHW